MTPSRLSTRPRPISMKPGSWTSGRFVSSTSFVSRRCSPCSPTLYRERNRVERFFNRLKHYRRIATRYDKLAENYLAMIKIATIRIWLRDMTPLKESTAQSTLKRLPK